MKNLAAFLVLMSLTGCLSSDKKDGSAVKDVFNSFTGEPVVPREANKIIIPAFNNLSKEHSLSLKLTVKIREQINLDGRLAVVPENNEADLILRGIMTDYQVQPLEYRGFDKPVRKRLRIIASVTLFDIKKDKEIFFERGIQAFEEFSDIIPPITSEVHVRDKVLDELAKRIALKTINGWYTKLMTPVEKGKK